jgi:tetratricopeptide (TPR) repeat protein
MKKYIIHVIMILIITLAQLPLWAQNPEDAIRLSHAGKYDEAEKIFSKLIMADGKNTGLLVASGFNNAWGKKYSAAKKRFQQALQLEPENPDAAKGLAYTYLYNGEFTKAANAFSVLSAANFSNEEYHFALGLAYMNLQKKNKASLEFEKALSINKSNTEAEKFITEIKAGKKILEFSVLGGLSNYEDKNKFGLRQIQAGYHVNDEVSIYARYDNSLTQENYFFIKNNFNSTAFLGGVYTRWHQQLGSKFEYSYRSLPGKLSQHIFQTEQTVFLPKNYAVKLGGSLLTSNQPQQKEWMLMGSVAVPVGKKIKIEPYYYFLHREYNEHRLLLNLNYNFSAKTDIALGAFNGTEKNTKTNVKTNVLGLYAYSNFLITQPLSGMLMARYEKDAFDRKAFIIVCGLKIRLDTKRF